MRNSSSQNYPPQALNILVFAFSDVSYRSAIDVNKAYMRIVWDVMKAMFAFLSTNH